MLSSRRNGGFVACDQAEPARPVATSSYCRAQRFATALPARRLPASALPAIGASLAPILSFCFPSQGVRVNSADLLSPTSARLHHRFHLPRHAGDITSSG